MKETHKQKCDKVYKAMLRMLDPIQIIPGVDRPLRKGDVRLNEAKIAVYDGKRWVEEETEKEAGTRATSGR